MIAEKTADAIRGRKLTPFEPPTRAAYPAGHASPVPVAPPMPAPHPPSPVGYNQDHHTLMASPEMQTNSLMSGSTQQPSAIYYSGHAAEQILPDMPANFASPNADLANSTYYNLASDLAASAAELSRPSYLDAFAANQPHYSPIAQGPMALSPWSARDQDEIMRQNHDFLINKYGNSMMMNNLIRRSSALR